MDALEPPLGHRNVEYLNVFSWAPVLRKNRLNCRFLRKRYFLSLFWKAVATIMQYISPLDIRYAHVQA